MFKPSTLLQYVRDEAHRFAIAYHREKRSRTMTTSALDDVAGLGDVRRKALLRHFGSIKRLRAASPDDIAEVEGFGPRLAEAVANALRERQDGDAAGNQAGSRPGEPEQGAIR